MRRQIRDQNSTNFTLQLNNSEGQYSLELRLKWQKKFYQGYQDIKRQFYKLKPLLSSSQLNNNNHQNQQFLLRLSTKRITLNSLEVNYKRFYQSYSRMDELSFAHQYQAAFEDLQDTIKNIKSVISTLKIDEVEDEIEFQQLDNQADWIRQADLHCLRKIHDAININNVELDDRLQKPLSEMNEQEKAHYFQNQSQKLKIQPVIIDQNQNKPLKPLQSEQSLERNSQIIEVSFQTESAQILSSSKLKTEYFEQKRQQEMNPLPWNKFYANLKASGKILFDKEPQIEVNKQLVQVQNHFLSVFEEKEEKQIESIVSIQKFEISREIQTKETEFVQMNTSVAESVTMNSKQAQSISMNSRKCELVPSETREFEFSQMADLNISRISTYHIQEPQPQLFYLSSYLLKEDLCEPDVEKQSQSAQPS